MIIDDGVILYLNGVEIYRRNVAAGQLTVATRATTVVDTPCTNTSIELTVTNLLPRTNWLAAAVLNHDGSAPDIYFGLESDGVFFRSGLVPTNGPANLLYLTPTRTTDGLRITWPNTAPNIYYGYFLEESSALANASSTTHWHPVSRPSNPMIIPASQPAGFYRLRQGPNTGR